MTPARLKLLLPLLALAAALLAGCGDTGAGGSGAAEPAGESASEAFPARIAHKYGTTDVPAEPKRIVTVGISDHEHVLSLGFEPVAIRDWVGEGPVTEVPWARERIARMRQKPVVLSQDDLNVEQVASLRPDLIIGLFSGMTRREYDRLSRLAPTIAPPKGVVDFGIPWQDQIVITGRALGREPRAREIRAGLEARFRAAREANPEFAGKAGLVPYSFDPGTFGAYTSGDLRSRFISELGFRIPAEVDELAGDAFFVEFSKEQFRLLEQEALLFYGAPRTQRSQVERDPLYRRLRAVREGRVIYMDAEDTLLGAVGLSTPYSLPYAIDQAVPRLKAAVDGDPATKVPETE